MIYLDNAATTFPKPEAVYRAMDEMNRNGAVNAGRGSYKAARKASGLISETKRKLRNLIQADADAAVIFAPSVTIAMNQIVNGLKLRNGAVVYVSPYEHNAVARSLHLRANFEKFCIKELAIDSETLEMDLEKIKYQFSQSKPDAVFCTHVSNVTGYILPVSEIFAEAKRYNCVTVLDSAQSLGLIEIEVNQINADIIAFAGHKTLYGPFGIGGFVNVSHVPLKEFIAGGTGSNSLELDMPEGAEAKFEASSSNIVAIAGLNAALSELKPKEILNHEEELTKYLVEGLSKIKELQLYTQQNLDKQVGIVSFSCEGLKAEDIGQILDEDYNIAVRTGYHCAPFIHKYLKDEGYLGTVRVGVGQFTSRADVDSLINAVREIVYE